MSNKQYNAIRSSMLLLFFIAVIYFGNAQSVVVQGKITDSLQNPLPYTNILAFPAEEGKETQFAITNEEGIYKLSLQKQVPYNIEISYLGYKKLTATITLTQNTTKNFVLQPAVNELDEVEVTYKIPVVVKEDTIVYNTDAFVSGKERKLREVLKKLPGIEVDREGNVKANGKKIKKLLVDNKPFFTGNTKMAVNNIPADVVDQVEVLENYNEVAMLKGLQDTDDTALNIKLKKDRKKFAFGDIETGLGYNEKYTIHPNLFYYSPKTNINFIADVNNTGVKAFTFSDYIEFEGGFGKLLENSGSYFSIYSSDFAQFLNNQDFKNSIHKFGAVNIRQAVNSSTDISGYVIASKNKTQTETQVENLYLNEENAFVENRNNTATTNNFFTLGKITIDYEPTYQEDLSLNSFFKITSNNNNGIITTTTPTVNNVINTLTNVKALTFKQNVNYSRKLSDYHTGTLEATYNFQTDKPNTNWITNQEILQGLLPLVQDSVYTILQTKSIRNHSFNAIVKDYWVLNNFNHIYTSIGINSAFNTFNSFDEQVLSNGNTNNFSEAGFNNDFRYNFINTYVGLEYKFKTGIFTFKPALYYHFYTWSTQQTNQKLFNNKAVLLPEATTTIEFNNSEKINVKYKLNARFPAVNRLANNFILSNFNSVFKGNETLENELYHSASINYSKFSLLKGLYYNANISYTKRLKHYKNVTQLQGIDYYSTPILFNMPEDALYIHGSFSKKIRKIRFRLSGRYNYSNFFQLINNATIKNKSQRFAVTPSIETRFKKWPNLEVGYTKDFSNYESLNTTSKFENNTLFAYLDYTFLEDFTFKAEYNYNNYINKTSGVENTFDNANVSLFYKKEDSAWGFELKATNLFNTQFKQENAFNNFLISDQRTFIMPRIILFTISYKL